MSHPFSGKREPLEVERLVPKYARAVTIDDHAAFRESLGGPARRRKSSEVSKVESILDELLETESEG